MTPIKPGYLTSEFWLKNLAFLLTALYASGVIPTSGPLAQAMAIAATMLGAIGYSVSRGLAKSRPLVVAKDNTPTVTVNASPTAQAGFIGIRLMATLAALAIAAALCIGCGAVQNGATAVIDCTVADAPKIEALVSDFEHKIINGTGTWASIEAEAEAAGKTIGGCALAEVVQTFLTAKTTQASTPAASQAAAALEQFRIRVAGGASFHTNHGDL